MSTLLRPTFHGCQASLRRRSSCLVEPLDLLRRSSLSASPVEECAISDDYLPEPSPAHVPDYALEALHVPVPRRTDTDDTLIPSTPSSATEPKSIPANPAAVDCAEERFKWRIASGYFAYFVCGYGDGCECFQFDFSERWMTDC